MNTEEDCMLINWIDNFVKGFLFSFFFVYASGLFTGRHRLFCWISSTDLKTLDIINFSLETIDYPEDAGHHRLDTIEYPVDDRHHRLFAIDLVDTARPRICVFFGFFSFFDCFRLVVFLHVTSKISNCSLETLKIFNHVSAKIF